MAIVNREDILEGAGLSRTFPCSGKAVRRWCRACLTCMVSFLDTCFGRPGTQGGR
ncbi:hypothetical protein CGRA01v4_09130 [Colletotrichum graminicola]|nr:hypothetical protein CGRA01v4_09130 [Colletotrichum graminicola]